MERLNQLRRQIFCFSFTGKGRIVTVFLQKFPCYGMKGSDGEFLCGGIFSRLFPDTFPHLLCCLIGKGDGRDTGGLNPTCL